MQTTLNGTGFYQKVSLQDLNTMVRLSHLAAGAVSLRVSPDRIQVAVKRRMPIHLKAVLVCWWRFYLQRYRAAGLGSDSGQLYRWYIVATIAVILLYVSTSEAVWEEFIAPFRELLLGRTAFTKPLRIVVFIFCPRSLAGIFPAGRWRCATARRLARHPSHTACIGEF